MGATYVDVTIRNPRRAGEELDRAIPGGYRSVQLTRAAPAFGSDRAGAQVASRHRVDLRYRLRRSYPSGILGILGIRVILTCRA